MKKKLFLLLVIFLTTVCIQVHAKDNFYADDNIKLTDSIPSTSFVAGNSVEVTGKNDGISFIAGNNIKVKNERDYLLVGGNTINIEEVTTKDAFIAGSLITIDSSSMRDLYAAGQKIVLNSEVSGDAYLGGEEVEINSIIKGNVKIAAEKIKLGENAKIEGTLLYPKEAELKKNDNVVIAKEKTYKGTDIKKEDKVKEEIIDFITTVTSMILIAVILLALNPKVFTKITKINKSSSEIIKTSLIGLAMIILVPIIGLILVMSTLGTSLGIICLLIYGIMFYLSAIPTSYFIGNWVLKDKIKSNYLVLIISIIALYIIRLIPIIGGIVTFLSLCFGLGIYFTLIKENTSLKKEKK